MYTAVDVGAFGTLKSLLWHTVYCWGDNSGKVAKRSDDIELTKVTVEKGAGDNVARNDMFNSTVVQIDANENYVRKLSKEIYRLADNIPGSSLTKTKKVLLSIPTVVSFVSGCLSIYNAGECGKEDEGISADESAMCSGFGYASGVVATVSGAISLSMVIGYRIGIQVKKFNYLSDLSNKVIEEYSPIVVDKTYFKGIKTYGCSPQSDGVSLRLGIRGYEKEAKIYNSGYFCIKKGSAGDFNVKEDVSSLYYIEAVNLLDSCLKLSFFPTTYVIAKGEILKASNYSSEKNKVGGMIDLYIPLNDIVRTWGNESELKSMLNKGDFSKDKYVQFKKDLKCVKPDNHLYLKMYLPQNIYKEVVIYFNNPERNTSVGSHEVNDVMSVHPVFIEKVFSKDQVRPNYCRLLFSSIDNLKNEHVAFVSKEPLCSLSEKCTGINTFGDSSSLDKEGEKVEPEEGVATVV